MYLPVNRLRSLPFITRNENQFIPSPPSRPSRDISEFGLNRVGGRLLGGADAGLVFVMAGEVALRLVTQTGGRLLDGGAIA